MTLSTLADSPFSRRERTLDDVDAPPRLGETTEPLVVHGTSRLAAVEPVRVRADAVASPSRRILLYGLNFAPEPTGIGKYTGEMAQWLASVGHEVRVITSPPYYPDWNIAAGYTGARYTQETWCGVSVERAPLWVPKRPSGAKRLLHLASFAAFSMPLLMKCLAWRPQVVVCVAPALACAPGAAFLARLSGAISWLYIQDFEVDAAFNMGMLRGRRLRALAVAAERLLLRSFDRVSSISHRMVGHLREKGVAPERILYSPNWVDPDVIRPMPSNTVYRRALGIAPDAFVVLYSGTMGAKQGLEILAEAARRLAHREDIHFVFCGQGAGREALRAACAGLQRIHWLPLQRADRLAKLLSTADLHLLPQQKGAGDVAFPSKLSGMLASGRPVLACADAGTAVFQWVEGCGMVVPPGDAAAFVEALDGLSRNRVLRQVLGKQARLRALDRLARNSVLSRFEAEMEIALAARA